MKLSLLKDDLEIFLCVYHIQNFTQLSKNFFKKKLILIFVMHLN
jgi:hypothetical protein